ncbi:MAG: aminotransferase class I/II-fold pyridoxal phosphate-dependent enzyme [Firmicutes bacterium]|nr:aminotransferase class I/II-fold pyridoxal phosphate-dependent enzyme [Bacillota bacterium]
MKTEFSQTEAPLFEELARYSGKPLISFHTPGHKMGAGLEPEWHRPGFTARIDLTEITALDWQGALEKAQLLAARFFKSDCCLFLTQGASQGLIGALAGAFAPGEKVLVARNCHLSVIKGMIIAGLTPVFIETEILPDWGIPSVLSERDLRAKIQKNPDYKGLIVTNPTYQGIAGRVQKYRDLIGAKILILDEAHGGHLGWSGLDGYNAFEAADLWVQGTHKILGSFTQTGMLHLREKRLEPGSIQQGVDLISTTSPSYVLLASLDSNRRFLATTGAGLFREKSPELKKLRSQIANYDGVRILEDISSEVIVDPWKITLSFLDSGFTGRQAAAILEREFRIQPEYADYNQVTCLIAPWQAESDLQALLRAVAVICNRKTGRIKPLNCFPESIPPQALPIREAFFAPKTAVSLEQAIGRIASRIIAPYPPGVPLLVPGELIGIAEVETIQQLLSAGGLVRGLEPDGKISVVKENG